jgi:RNA polymerase sigma-70 factor, ECF subfamily
MGPYSSLSVEELVRRCAASGEIAAWEEFVRRFHRLIAKVILRTCNRFGDSSNQTVDDLIQDTYLKLCAHQFRLLRGFDHRHPNAFLGFLQVVARNVARDFFKRKRIEDDVEPLPEGHTKVLNLHSPDDHLMMERKLLIEEVERHVDVCVKGTDEGRNRRIFWLRHHAGLSAAEIARLPGINLTHKGVESLDMRILHCVRERMAAQKPARPDAKPNPDEGILTAESF